MKNNRDWVNDDDSDEAGRIIIMGRRMEEEEEEEEREAEEERGRRRREGPVSGRQGRPLGTLGRTTVYLLSIPTVYLLNASPSPRTPFDGTGPSPPSTQGGR